MKGLVQKIYAAFVIIAALLLLIAGIDSELNITQRKRPVGYHKAREYEYTKVTDYSAPLGIREEYVISPAQFGSGSREFMFYTIHQNAEVYVGGERVYSMRAKHDNFIGKTPGCVWNDVALTADDLERTITVRIFPVYNSSIGITPEFYFGEKTEITQHVVLRDIPAMLLSLVGIVTGIFFIAYIMYNFKNSELDKSLVMLGCFALTVGIWKMTDLETIGIWFPNNAGLYLVPLLMISLSGVPFTMFIKELSSYKESRVWYITCFSNLAVLAVSLFLQMMGIKDLRQTLWMVHVMLVAVVAVTSGMIFYEVRTLGWNEKLKRNTVFIVFCLIGFIVDLAVYYVGKGKYVTVLGMIGFIAYILASGAYFMREARQLMNIGMRARNFERMAFHDQLTGLFNRTAFSSYVDSEDFDPERCIVAVFDLNDLKKCNDLHGHEKGDVYIKECAWAIRDTFEDSGKCYRMGGDEFCVLMQNTTLEQCKQKLRDLKDAVKKRNEKYPEINMAIACGYEIFDRRIDYDINDTSRRADKKMYREKFSMKEKKS